MKSKEEIKQWLLENAVDEYGYVNLSGIDFGELTVYFSGVKAKRIYNNSQEAYNIYNSYQEAYNIYNSYQEAYNIYNYSQEAYNIYNSYQEATNYIDNHSQRAEYIHNNSQRAKKYFNTHNAVIDGVQYEIDTTNGIYLIVHKKRTYNGITFIQGENIMGDIGYLYKNNLVSYHAFSKQGAKDGFKRKLSGFTAKQEIIDKIKSTQRITRTQYHELTGACDMGIQAFAKRIGKPDRDYLTLKELATLLTPNDYGYNYLKQWGVIE